MFVEEELFEGNNLYRCAQCDRLVTAAKVSASFQTVNKITCYNTVQYLRDVKILLFPLFPLLNKPYIKQLSRKEHLN